jgi:hypothetical protein
MKKTTNKPISDEITQLGVSVAYQFMLAAGAAWKK